MAGSASSSSAAAASSSSSSSSSSPSSSSPSTSTPVPSSNWLSGVNVVLVMAYGSLVFVLLFIFVKRQIMRFAMKSRRGPHVPVGQHAPKGLKEEIDIRLSRVQDIRYEPQLLLYSDPRLLQLESPRTPFPYDYVYRMKALDAVRETDIPYSMEGRYPKLLMEKNFHAYLLDLRNSSSPVKGLRKALIDALLDGYENARYGTGVFSNMELLRFQEALNELAAIIKARGESSQRQHQSAAKDLTLSPDPTIQVTYLPSTQKSKRAKHFLELKSFKDNYNTLESTL
ncbi:protein C1orf43 homolog isoform X1 [Erythrolamprus reginae]|uniref:protein C1orf43 homolog isoform X1 n=2 Tax=Erythrolamprus reginae TaxID=121349 RepID=UPI00396D00CB